MTTTVDIDVRHDADNHRYEASVVEDGQHRVVGVLRYERTDDVLTVPSTVVVPDYRGRGVAGALTARVLDDVRAHHLRIRPECWYVARWLERHPECADLVWTPDTPKDVPTP